MKWIEPQQKKNIIFKKETQGGKDSDFCYLWITTIWLEFLNHNAFILNQAIRLRKYGTRKSAGIFKATTQPNDTTHKHHMFPWVSVIDLRQSANMV